MKNTKQSHAVSSINKKAALATAIALTMASGVVLAQAETQTRTILSGSDAVKLSISGQINRAALIVEDGEETEFLNVDNNQSSSRVRFIAESTNMGAWTAGAALETEFRLNNSFTIDQTEEYKNDETGAFRHRRVEVYFENDNIGKFWLGQGWTATEGVSETDLSGTSLVGYSDPNTYSGGILFRDKDTGLLTTTSLSNVADNLDGFGRNNRIRYDTPKFGGFQVRTSLVQSRGTDFAVFYNGNLDRMKLAASIGYGNTSELSATPTYDDQISGSVSVLDTSGFNATLALGQASAVDSTKEDASFTYVKLGYQASLISAGKSAFSIDYQQTNDKQVDDDTVDIIGAQYVQQINAIGTEAYAALRSISLDRTGVDYEDNLVAMVGARVKF